MPYNVESPTDAAALNSNFALLVEKCRGVTPARDNTRPADSQSLWDDLKDNMKEWGASAVEKAEEISRVAVAKGEEFTKISKV